MALSFEISNLAAIFIKSRTIQTTARSFSISQALQRKPIRLGRAPSKEGIYFEKPKPTLQDLKRGEIAYKSYNELLQSIAASFQEELFMKEGNTNSSTTVHFDEKAYHEKCMEYNDTYNTRMRLKREPRLIKILQQQDNGIQEKEMKYEEELMLKLKKFEDEVSEALSECSNWVTLDNLEEKISRSLDNIVNYNFSVNRMGKVQTRTLIP